MIHRKLFNILSIFESFGTVTRHQDEVETLQSVIKQQQIPSKLITDDENDYNSSYHSYRQLFILTKKQQNQRINEFEIM